MGAISFGVDVSLEAVNTWKFATLRKAAAASLAASGGARGGAGSGFGFYAALVSICLGLAGTSAAMVAFGSPWSAGSGIPEVKAYLNGVHIPGEM
jgi:chloride channel 7